MAASPFGPDVPELDDGGSLDAASAPPGELPKPKTSQWESLLKLAIAAGMITPMGKGAKGLAAALGIGGGTMLASGVAGAAQAKKAATKAASAAPELPAELMPAAPGGVQDEFSANEAALRAQLEPWVKQLQKGGKPLPETQAVVNDLNGRLEEIAKARLKKQTDKLSYEKAQKSGEDMDSYRNIGLGVGATAGTLAALVSGGKLWRATSKFNAAGGAAEKFIKEPGNLMVAKGGRGSAMHGAVNDAYHAGGAPTPFPPMQGIYKAGSAGDAAALSTAKGDFAAGASKVPISAPFAKDQSNLGKVAEYAPYAAGLGEIGTFGTLAAQEDNPDQKQVYKNMMMAGLAGTAGYGVARKGLGFASKNMFAPGADAGRAVAAGRERLQNDVQNIGLKDLRAYQKQIGDIAVGGLPKAKGKLVPGDAARMAQIRPGAVAVNQARADFIAKADLDTRITQAHAASLMPDKSINAAAFRKALRQIFTGTHEHNGTRIKINNRMVSDLLKRFGSGP